MNLEPYKQRKKDLHLTYDDLSKMTGLSRKTIVNFFTNSTEPRKETVIEISAALNIETFTLEELTAGASATRCVNITPIDDELLYAFRRLGKKHGENTQRGIIDMIEKML